MKHKAKVWYKCKVEIPHLHQEVVRGEMKWPERENLDSLSLKSNYFPISVS